MNICVSVARARLRANARATKQVKVVASTAIILARVPTTSAADKHRHVSISITDSAALNAQNTRAQPVPTGKSYLSRAIRHGWIIDAGARPGVIAPQMTSQAAVRNTAAATNPKTARLANGQRKSTIPRSWFCDFPSDLLAPALCLVDCFDAMEMNWRC